MGLNILITDDSLVMRSMISRSLRLSGLPLDSVYMATNGAECLKILNTTWIDILFLDLNMPVLDGFEVLEIVGKDKTLKDTRVIVVSAESNKERLKSLETKGVTAFVGKPFTPEAVKAAVSTAMGGIDLVHQ